MAWLAFAVAVIAIVTLVQIQREPYEAGWSPADGFVRLVLFGLLLSGFIVLTCLGKRGIVRAFTFGRVELPKPTANPRVIRFDIPEKEDGNRLMANLVAIGLFLIGLGFTVVGATTGLAMINGEAFSLLSTVTFLVAGLAVFPTIPAGVRWALDGGYTRPIEITFTPVGMSQPVDDGQKTVAWPSIAGFVFDRHRGGRRVDAHIAISDERGRQQLLPVFAKESAHGFLMTTAMDPAEAERAAAAIERFRPGLVEWRDQRVRRGGFGLEKRDGGVIVRWPERDRPDAPGSAPQEEQTVVARESRLAASVKGLAAWSVAAVFALTLLTVIRHADELVDGLRFLVVAGIVAVLAGVLTVAVTGRRAVLARFALRRHEILAPKPLAAETVGFGIPDNGKFFARILSSGLNGIGWIVFGGGLFVVAEHAEIDDGLPMVLGSVVFTIGLFLLGSLAFRHRETTKSLPVSVTDDGLEQPVGGDRTLVLSWDEIKEVVLDEHLAGGHFSAHVALVDVEAEVLLRHELRKESRFGHQLTPTMTAAEADRFAALVESRRPGLVRRPAREVTRGGLGVVGVARRVILRWKDGTTPRPAPQDGLSISKVADADKQRRAGVIALVAAVVLGFGVISDTGVAVRVVAALLGLLMFWMAVVSLRRDQSQVVRELALKSRWITVTTLTSRTWNWSMRWSDIEKVMLRRTSGTDTFHVVLRPSDRVDAYYPRERLAMPLGLKREDSGDILIAETELTSEDVKQIWPVLERNTEVAFDTPGAMK
ncbi:hypothetical protein [Amycolatopsis azurea]|uniref:Uncharacterized protein n=1 Tax=Amycolatopsis azurea DSM 43854 TaxID=1238180 RepID=M2Q7R5_9PSEU|nr:hypothetical protein [Amycolatopsis azurea]EMD28010.1 hypothetical protein C791_1462 [Amycolatopsis azurea DSM 43854]OOC05393.1 hypothetical protein B0293_18320 [Amycolatopsis azurea DSM 43854]